MKKIVIIVLVSGAVAFIDAQLRIRQENPTWRTSELLCCIDQRNVTVPWGVENAEDAVLALREKVRDEYDKGTYQADWGKYRRRALEIQSLLGYTVPDEESPTSDDDSFDSSYDDL